MNSYFFRVQIFDNFFSYIDFEPLKRDGYDFLRGGEEENFTPIGSGVQDYN